MLVGHFVTSLDMMGVSLALLRLDEPQWVDLLDAPAQVSMLSRLSVRAYQCTPSSSLISSLDMMGVSLALLRLDDPQWAQLLDAPAQMRVCDMVSLRRCT